MSVGETGFGALDATAAVVEGPAAQAERVQAAALLAEAERQFEAAGRAVAGTAAKLEKFEQLAMNAVADHQHACDEADRLLTLVTERRAILEGLN